MLDGTFRAFSAYHFSVLLGMSWPAGAPTSSPTSATTLLAASRYLYVMPSQSVSAAGAPMSTA